MGRKKTHEEFMKDFEEKQPELFARVEVLEKYKGATVKIKCRCLIDEYEWETRPHDLLHGHGCPKCTKHTQYTTESFKEKLKEINSNIEIIGEYVKTKTKIKCRCLIDGYEWEATPGHLLHGHGCHRCANSERYTTETFKEKLKEINPNIEIIGEYAKAYDRIECKCLIDNYIWNPKAYTLLNGNGCPRCSHNNSSWLQDELFEYFSRKYPLTRFRDRTIINMELDIVIPELKLAIEPGGWHWHYEVEDKRENDAEKRRLCAEKGYTCITIYDGCDKPELVSFKDEITCLIYGDNISKHKYLLDDVLDSIEDIIKTR